jgi:nitroimidazol reductase NimA-like FMN-containing flavoprotein (pyridoxamine 5'-phosphate oxidase superfamily)
MVILHMSMSPEGFMATVSQRPESHPAGAAPRRASEPDPVSTARQIIDTNRYLTLATADSAGNPWASPVWYAHADYTSFFWVSQPQARHSCNLAARAAVSLVVFDSTVPERQAQAVYLTALAKQLNGAERDHAIEIFSRKSQSRGLREWRTADVTTSAPQRLYVARASACYILAPGDQRLPVKIGSSPARRP